MSDDAPMVPPRRPRGRPPKISVAHADVSQLTAEEVIDRLAEAITPSVESLRLKADRGNILTSQEITCAGKLARTLETLARAKRKLQEIGKDGDLTGIPTEQLARVVVRAMRDSPELKAAIAAEMAKGAEA